MALQLRWSDWLIMDGEIVRQYDFRGLPKDGDESFI
jgi:hypothetical protein